MSCRVCPVTITRRNGLSLPRSRSRPLSFCFAVPLIFLLKSPSLPLGARFPRGRYERSPNKGTGGRPVLFNWDEFSPADSERQLWDVIVIGAGMGGGTLGYDLARRGLKVLFLERGSAPTLFPKSFEEGRLKRILGLERPEGRLTAMGRWPHRLTIMKDGKGVDFLAPMGAGPGGSSAIYGAGLERMRRVDFSASTHPGEDPQPIKDDWPVSYDEFRKHYEKAEALFGVGRSE